MSGALFLVVVFTFFFGGENRNWRKINIAAQRGSNANNFRLIDTNCSVQNKEGKFLLNEPNFFCFSEEQSNLIIIILIY
jgi:hypothetical protein